MAKLQATLQAERREAGCDEAGRGCLAGPVFAAAVLLPPTFDHPLLHDSKKMSEKQRRLLRPILENEALSWAVASVSPAEIDSINILQASFLAMHRAIAQLSPPPEYLVIDGNRFKPYPGIAHSCAVKGDGRFRHVAAASVLAKTHRDAYMEKAHHQYPQYGWSQNKGYPTPAHRAALQAYGASPQHRKSFSPVAQTLKLDL